MLDGSTIVAETRKDEYGTVTHQLYYYYDENGSPVGLNWNGQDYYYYKNIFGDVLGIFNSSGTLVVRYSYDAWGCNLGVTGTLATTLGHYNPFRYRGYYYDVESGMYYLNARYYNPYWCRFISPAPVLDANSSVGHNLFFHSEKNPLNCSNATINVFLKNNQPPMISSGADCVCTVFIFRCCLIRGWKCERILGHRRGCRITVGSCRWVRYKSRCKTFRRI
ncbi:MAG: hypothetical protein J6M34_01060 [Clostridia bacterium]|nr:hypothetical protein [Clostridia bacterium]